jgi:hypothetical protein
LERRLYYVGMESGTGGKSRQKLRFLHLVKEG